MLLFSTNIYADYPPDSYQLSSDGKKLERWISEDSIIDMNSDSHLKNVEIIGYRAFGDNPIIKRIYFGDKLDSIGQAAFYQCVSIDTVIITKKLTHIANNAFVHCTGIKNFTVDENNPAYTDLNGVLYSKDKSIIYRYPSQNQATEYTIDPNAVVIETGCFQHNLYLKKININDLIKRIEASALEDLPLLEEIILPKSLEHLGRKAIYNCFSLKSISISDENTYFKTKNGILYTKNEQKLIKYPTGSNNTTFEMPGTVKMVDEWAFESANYLKNIVSNNKIQKIDACAFQDCNNLETVSLLGGLDTLEFYSFMNCKNLKKLSVNSAIPPYTEESGTAFLGVNKDNVLLNIPIASLQKYKDTPVWKDFLSINEVSFDGGIQDNSSLKFICRNNQLTVLPEIQFGNIRIYDISGKLIYNEILYESIKSFYLNTGMYIVTYDRVSYKVIL